MFPLLVNTIEFGAFDLFFSQNTTESAKIVPAEQRVYPELHVITARFTELHILGLGHMEEPFFCNHLAVLRVLVP